MCRYLRYDSLRSQLGGFNASPVMIFEYSRSAGSGLPGQLRMITRDARFTDLGVRFWIRSSFKLLFSGHARNVFEIDVAPRAD